MIYVLGLKWNIYGPKVVWHNNNAAACTQLNDFSNQVSTKQTNRELTSQQAADLRQQTAAIQSAIGCSKTASSSSPLPLPLT